MDAYDGRPAKRENGYLQWLSTWQLDVWWGDGKEKAKVRVP